MINRIIHHNTRGITRTGWLTSHHSFSFGGWFDPDRRGFGTLRVLNDDQVSPASGFDLHPHRDMEIISIVLSGELEHQDTMGNQGVIREGDVQVMSAGTGIEHGERNPSSELPVHFLQIWVHPDRTGHAPRYDQSSFPTEPGDELVPIVSDGSVPQTLVIHSSAVLYVGRFAENTAVDLPDLKPGRGQYMYVASGSADTDGQTLTGGDALRRQDPQRLTLEITEPATIVLIDVPVSDSE